LGSTSGPRPVDATDDPFQDTPEFDAGCEVHAA
jgi:hypothetical protein